MTSPWAVVAPSLVSVLLPVSSVLSIGMELIACVYQRQALVLGQTPDLFQWLVWTLGKLLQTIITFDLFQQLHISVYLICVII